ncbi:hypothetical protein OG401_21110 [Kitasatospora purpeofusca]|uniref:hypothetical protein n=1 Tax=Kitasatospora purpeofusca TaxID=67352 RepID=UPI002251B3CC|nr:hypothetical protein [Kitasatospora purpeofusca]MCX4686781.1 hypothetical protein [Kitasatospora purpeofusca]
MSALTHRSTPHVNALTIGGVYTATLTGLAGPWTIHGHATLWAAADTEDGPHLVLEISDAPTPGEVSGSTSHRAYARGTVSRLPDGRRQLVNPLTPQPGPAVIGLGFTLRARRDPADAAAHVERAIVTLADWTPLPDDSSPLGVNALTHLARAAARASELRDAEGERDDLVRRLRAGGVPRDLVARADGRDPSRITQLCRPSADRARVSA